MSRFDEMADAARRKHDRDLRSEILGLSRDPRFASVLEAIRRSREAWVAQTCAPGVAGEPGKITHSAGGVFAMDNLLAQLRGVVDNAPAITAAREPGDG